jgi:hypothetical protein
MGVIVRHAGSDKKRLGKKPGVIVLAQTRYHGHGPAIPENQIQGIPVFLYEKHFRCDRISHQTALTGGGMKKKRLKE